MWAALSIVLVVLAIGLMPISLFLSGVCWTALYYTGTKAAKDTRESRLLPWAIVAAALVWAIHFVRWAWHTLA